MQILIGLGSGLIFCCFLICAFYAGYKLGSKMQDKESQASKLTDKEKQELKLRMEGLQNIMNYDIRQAMGVKHE